MNNCCPDDTCQQIVPVTVTNNTFVIDSVGLSIVNVQDSPTQVTLTITADVADFINLNCYFTDNPANPTEKSVVAPPTPGDREFILTTDANGVVSLICINGVATDTWYLVIVGLNGVLAISDAITIGI